MGEMAGAAGQDRSHHHRGSVNSSLVGGERSRFDRSHDAGRKSFAPATVAPCSDDANFLTMVAGEDLSWSG